MSIIVGPAAQFGETVAWKLPNDERKKFLRRNLPKNLGYDNVLTTFKEDFEIDYSIDKLQEVDIFYITQPGEELYYFRVGNRLFHGNKVWSKWHSFIPFLNDLRPSKWIGEPSFFVGSRPNYTHQTIDFLPNLLLKSKLQGITPKETINIIGKKNQILEQYIKFIKETTNRHPQFTQLADFEDLNNSRSFGGWQIKCITFRELYLVRHLSIFTAFNLLHEMFRMPIENTLQKDEQYQNYNKRTIFLSRNDDRILNQKQLCETLSSKYSVEISNDLTSLSVTEKFEYLSIYGTLILPPGSESINAFCFSDNDSHLIQMIPRKLVEILDTPFHSLAGFRYYLPFLNRISFWEPDSFGPGINSGRWSLRNISDLNNLAV